MTQTRNLGLVKAIFVGPAAPTNKDIIWRDTIAGVHKAWSITSLIWESIGGGGGGPITPGSGTTPNGTAVDLVGTLSTPAIITGDTTNIFKLVFNNLITTPVNGAGIWLANTAPATLAVPIQQAPSIVLEGQAWTYPGTISQKYRIENRVLDDDFPGEFAIAASVNGGAYEDMLTLNGWNGGFSDLFVGDAVNRAGRLYLSDATGIYDGVTSENAALNITAGTGHSIEITVDGGTPALTIATSGAIASGTWQGGSISTTYTDAKIKTVTGVANRITISGTATDPIFNIGTFYVGQTSITTLGTVTTGTWNATTIGLTKGGTGTSLSDPGADKLMGWDDTDNTVGFWTLGTGLSYDHATHTLSASSVTPAALTKTNDTNVTLTLGGTPNTALLQAVSITAGWTGVLSSARGGTDNSTYAIGDILYASAAVPTLSKLTAVATGSVLGSAGINTAPAYLAVSTGLTATASTLKLGGSVPANATVTATSAGAAVQLRFETAQFSFGNAALYVQDDLTNVVAYAIITNGSAQIQAQWDPTINNRRFIFVDSMGTKRGIEYNATGYVTQTHSLVDKEYSDSGTSTLTNKTWNGAVIGSLYGGTGIANNAASTLTITGAFATTLTITGITGVTLPTAGTLATLAGAESLTNKKLGSLTTNGFVKTSGGDGTLSVDTTAYQTSGLSYLLASGGTLTGANTITGTTTNIVKYVFDNLVATQTNGAGIWLANTTAAINGTQQISPSIVWEAQGFATGVNNSQSLKFAAYVTPTQAATNPTVVWGLYRSVNGAAYGPVLAVDQGPTILANNTGGYSFMSGTTTTNGVYMTSSSSNLEFTLPTGFGVQVGATATAGPNSFKINQKNLATTGGLPILNLVSGAHTNLTASTEVFDVNFNLARTVQFAAGALAQQRAVMMQGPTYAFVGASTLTAAYTLYIDPPVAGTNATITRSYSLGTSGMASFGGDVYLASNSNIGVLGFASLNIITNSIQAIKITSGQNVIVGSTSPGDAARFNIVQNALTTTGGVPVLLMSGGAHTNLTLSTEVHDVNVNLTRIVQFATGALTLQRAFRIQAPTYAFVGASTLTDAYTLYIDPPVQGTNATITNKWALGMTGRMSILLGSGLALQVGADGSGGVVLTNSTAKWGGIVAPHYTNAEEPVQMIGSVSGTTANQVVIGGALNNDANAATSIGLYTAVNATTTGGTLRLYVDPNGNVAIGNSIGTGFGTNAAGVLAIHNGTAPTSSPSGIIQLYAENVSSSSELKVRDAAGNITTLSPHDFELCEGGPSEPGAWAHMSEYTNHLTGKRERVNVDMLKLARWVEKLTGDKLVFKEICS